MLAAFVALAGPQDLLTRLRRAAPHGRLFRQAQCTDRDGKPNQDFGRTTDHVGAQIAPKAFGSKGVFRSTLDHEVGGHIGQLINRTFSGPGAGHLMNEVEAYDRELRDAKENGLTDDEIGDIHNRRNWYLKQLDAENQARIDRRIYTPHK